MSVDTTQCDTAQCYFTSKSPEILDWIKLYLNYKDTAMMFNNIQKSKKRKMDCSSIESDKPWMQNSPQRSNNSNIEW